MVDSFSAKDQASLSDKVIAIVGLGLMGSSLGLALQKHCKELIGIDRDLISREYALRHHIVSQTFYEPEGVLKDVDLIVIATPVITILEIIRKLPAYVPGSPIIIDLGSTKRKIVNAMNNLPSRFEAVGGHPICGKETASIINADPEIYRGAPFVLTRTDRTTSRAIEISEELVIAIGSNPIWMDAEIHDLWIAATSHVPYLASIALANAIPNEAVLLSGPGLMSSTRLAGSSVKMMADIIQTNEDNILAQLRNFRQNLEIIEQLIESNDMYTLGDYLGDGRNKYQEIHKDDQ
jgi:prephenate dehydrogenase